MLKDTDKTTLILEQYRADIDGLAAQGQNAVSEAVAKAERQAKACAQEWRQANKTVELTANQEQVVADARLAGEEKLAAAASEEEDARIAADTVRRMIEDAATVRSVANKDTAKILERAETVLDETGAKAALFYQDKQKQRKEIESAMMRLYATEKAVLYTLAKAERNEGEKLLAKIIADKKFEVSAAEAEVLKQQQHKEDLAQEESQQRNLLAQLQEELERAEKKVLACREAEDEAQADFEQRLNQCREDIGAAVAKLQEQEDNCLLDQEAAEEALSQASQEAALQEKCSENAAQYAEKVRRNNEEAQIKAKNEQEATFAALEEQLSQRRQRAAVCNAAYIESVAKLDDAMAEADRLRGIVAEHAGKAAEAAAEEKSAREATETANRLANNAVKIRESISSESSQLLLHAQEVLMEAATSAQQLMDEKSVLRQAAEKECQRVSEQAVQMEELARQAEQQAGEAKIAWEEAEALLKKEQASAEACRIEVKQNMEQLLRQAKEEREAAETEAARARELADQAVDAMNAAQRQLEEIEEQLRRLVAEKQRLESEGQDRLAKLAQLAEDTLKELAGEKAKAEENVRVLQEQSVDTEKALEILAARIEEAGRQLHFCTGRVNEIIQISVAAIQAAEDDVQRRFTHEDAARQAAEDAVANMSGTASLAAQGQTGGHCSRRDHLAELTQIISSNKEADILAVPSLGDGAEPEPLAEAEEEAAVFPQLAGTEDGLELEFQDDPALMDLETVYGLPEDDFDFDPERDFQPDPVSEETLAEAEEAGLETESGLPLAAEPETEPETEEETSQPVPLEADQEPVAEESPADQDQAEGTPEAGEEPVVAAEPEPALAEEPEPETEAEADRESLPEAEAAGDDQAEGFDEPADAGEESFSGLSDEELEYTQRLESLSQDLLENTIIPMENEQAAARNNMPQAGNDYQSWMENLARSIGDEEGEARPELPAGEEAAPVQAVPELELAPLTGRLALDAEGDDDDIPTISEAVMQRQSEEARGAEEDELRLSILSTVDENKPKKRRFPFFS